MSNSKSTVDVTAAGERDGLPFSLTLHVRDHCLCLHVQRAARALARRFDDALRPLGLTQGQFSLLMSLNRPEPPSMKDVAALLAMDRTTLTANLKPLERRGLVKVKVDKTDKRGRRLHLTAAGQGAARCCRAGMDADTRGNRTRSDQIERRYFARYPERTLLTSHTHFAATPHDKLTRRFSRRIRQVAPWSAPSRCRLCIP